MNRMRSIRTRHQPARPLGLGRRVLASMLALFLCLQLFGLTPGAEAAELRLAPTKVTVQNGSESPASGGTAATNTYILEVSSGSRKGGGTADNVLYFVIYYTAQNGKKRSEVIFPGKDGIQRGIDKASQVANRNSRRQQVAQTFGYTTKELNSTKGLGSVQTDQYLFQTPEPIDTIDRIQIFGRLEIIEGADGEKLTGPSDWSCQGMRIYRADTLYGLEMYGWYSERGYIDFAGEVIAEVAMTAGTGIFRWNNAGGVFNIVPMGTPNGAAGITLVTKSNQAAFEDRYHIKTHVGSSNSTQVKNRVVFRLDMADMGKAGFESLAGSYEAGSHSTISSLGFCETAALTVRYQDIYGDIRQISLPLVVNSLGWTMEQVGDAAIAGFAQQGDSIALSAMLPFFYEIDSAYLTLGESEARAKTGLIDTGVENAVRARRAAASETDDIRYLCFAVYRDVSVEVDAENATLRYSFDAGAENPVQYHTSAAVEGVTISPGSDANFTLQRYTQGLVLHPVDRMERYLITLCTDNVENSGTTADLTIQIRYISMRDKELVSEEYNVRDYVTQFYGEWPGNGDNFAYNYGLRTGGTVQFMVPLQGVKQIKGISVKLTGGDEWQVKGMSAALVKSYGPRVASWEEIDEGGLKSHLRYSREVSAQSASFKYGVIYDPTQPQVQPGEDGWIPGVLVQDDGNVRDFDGSSREITTEDAIDWSTIRNYMTYEDTQQNLGFNTKRCIYNVNVKVAGDKVNANDDDCGSANLFYFQLVFEYGNSGCVLANQQLQADAFRTGAEARFQIPTAQDYGELLQILIIPDDQDSNGDIYDKLKISSIEVTKKTDKALSPTWIADGPDGLGWVGIDYRDPGVAGSNQGSSGRSLSEIAHSYDITKTSYSAKLLVSISTGSYGVTTKYNAFDEPVIVEDPILQGGLSVSYNYYNNEGRVVHVDPVDVVNLMNEYSGMPSNYTRTVEGFTETVDYAVSSVDYQFRPSTTDNFYINVSDISQIIDMQLQIRSSVVTKWNIQNVTVYLVNGQGQRYINENGEYDYKYPEGMELDRIASWNRTEGLVKDVQIYRTNMKNSVGEVNIAFEENSIELNSGAEMWSSVVAREPAAKNDALNIFLYPSTESSATAPESYDLQTTVRFRNALTNTTTEISTGRMNRGTDARGRTVFYALGVGTPNMESFTALDVKADAVRTVHAPISYGIVQRIRGGVLVDSYYVGGSGNADTGVTLKPLQNPGGRNTQRVLLQVSGNTAAQELLAEEKDAAVALYFRGSDIAGQELRTKYIYLSDMGYTSLRPGQILEVDFSIEDLGEVVGLNLVTLGRLDVSFSDGLVINQAEDGAVLNQWSFQGTMTPTRTPARFNTVGTVSLLNLELTTAEDDSSVGSGTTGPIRMVVGFYDEYGALSTRTYENIRDFVTGERCFTAGAVDKIRLLIPGMSQLRWVDLEPWDDLDSTATWKLAKLTASTGLNGYSVTRQLDSLIVEKEALRVSLADILVGGTYNIIRSPDQEVNPSAGILIPTGGSLDLALNAGEGIHIMPKLEGSDQGLRVELNRVEVSTGALGRADLQDTRGYTEALLEQYAQNALNEAEAAIWRSVVPDDGTWNVVTTTTAGQSDIDYIVFMPPRNYTGSIISYRITIYSEENNEARVVLNLSIPTEEDPVAKAVEIARNGGSPEPTEHTHNITFTAATPATCISPGQKAAYYCAGCGKYFSDALGNNEVPLTSLIQPATGVHSYGVWSDNGNGTHSRSCTVCGAKETKGCSYGSWISNHDGTHHRTCSVCGGQETAACSYRDVVIPPTATEQGYTEHICATCGYSYKSDYTDPVPPSSEETTAPTDSPEPSEEPTTEGGG
ncbi:MAG: hypothetical protein IKS05_00665 [Oscillospiraceae bacterium]|nr:hypothetical protein [Oscillospiraceae bacterium]